MCPECKMCLFYLVKHSAIMSRSIELIGKVELVLDWIAVRDKYDV